MKGVIFNITEKYISKEYGEKFLFEILESGRLQTDEPFVGPGTYPFEDLLEIVGMVVEKKDVQVNDFLEGLGVFAFLDLAKRHPVFLENHECAKTFLMTVDKIIHVEVRKLYSDASLPAFRYTEPSADELIITYYSEKKLYYFMKGLIQGVSELFGERIQQVMNIYVKGSIELCDFHLTFNGRS